MIATDLQINSREQSHVREQLVIWLKQALGQAAHRMQRPASRADASCKRQLRDVALYTALKQKLLGKNIPSIASDSGLRSEGNDRGYYQKPARCKDELQ